MKRYLVGLTAIVAGLLLCGHASAVDYNYDFDGLTPDEALSGQDNWLYIGVNNYVTVRDEADANKYGVPDNWTGFSGNVAEGGSPDTSIGRLNDANWNFSIPSDAPWVRFSYTIFTRGARSNLAGLGWDSDDDGDFDGDDGLMFQLGVNYNTNEWRLRASDNSSITSAGSGNATLSDVYKSYRLTLAVDFTGDDVLADMLVENLTAGDGVEVEVMSDVNLLLTGDNADPSNWDALFIRPYVSSMDDVTVTISGEQPPRIPGDANNNGIVDDVDASILAAHWQQSGNWGDGDFNGDNIVNDQDASILAAHWHETREGAAPVPEPSTLIGLLALGLAGLVALRRR